MRVTTTALFLLTATLASSAQRSQPASESQPSSGLARRLEGHTSSVLSIAFSHDGKTLATSARDDLVKLWDVQTGRLLRTLTQHTGDVYAVAFAPDDRTLASGSADKTVRLWDVQTGALKQTLDGHADVVRSVQFSPDGKLLVSSSADQSIRLWDARTGESKHTLMGHNHQVRSVAFTQDGKRLASGSVDRTVRLWDVESGSLKLTLKEHRGSVETVAVSPDGKIIASGSEDAMVRLWDALNGTLRHSLVGHGGEVDSVAFSPDGRLLASGSKDRTIKLWDAQSGKLVETLTGHGDRVESLAFSPDGKLLASGSGSKDSSVRLWEIRRPPGEEVFKMTQEQASLFARLALKGIQKEYPNKPGDVLNRAEDVKSPREVHPAFYGSFDWHSSVHGHWMLVRLLRLFPDLPENDQIRSVLKEHLTAKKLQAEADYFDRPHAQSFERPYGWAWLLKLAEELHRWDDPDAKQWSNNLRPLVDRIVARYLSYFPKQTYAIRSGVHPNTAFGLAFALDYAKVVEHKALRELIEERSRHYFARDANIPASWEPSGADFFSPSLMEADLMRRVLTAAEFQVWMRHFLPDLARGEPQSLLHPAMVTDRSDLQIVHLDGLNLSRAWCMRGIAAALPASDPARKVLSESATRHAQATLRHVASGDYAGEHWLASFAVYLLSSPSPD